MDVSVAEVAIKLSKYPAQIRDEMDTDDFALIRGMEIADNQEQQEVMRAQKKKAPAKARPQTMG